MRNLKDKPIAGSFKEIIESHKRILLMELLYENNFNILEVSRMTKLSRNTIYKIVGKSKKQLQEEQEAIELANMEIGVDPDRSWEL